MTEYLKKHIKLIEKSSLVYTNELGGELHLGGLDRIADGTASTFDHIISIIAKEQLEAFLHDSLSEFEKKRDQYEIEDRPFQMISDILDGITNDIHASLTTGKKIYVHCFMGRSRSAAIVTAYLVRYLGMPLDEAISFLRKKRSININHGFKKQLLEWDEDARLRLSLEKDVNYKIDHATKEK